MSQEIERDHNRRGMLQTMSAALIGVGVVAVIQFLTLPNLDRALTVSLYCFIVAIPSLTYYIVTLLIDAVLEKAEYGYRHNLVTFFIGIIASLSGMTSIFLHFSYKAGILFTAVCLLLTFGEHIYDKIRGN